MCAVGGAIYAQYQMYIGPETIAGIAVSLQIVFAVIAGGMCVMLGPDGRRRVHAAACRRVADRRSATNCTALDTMIYGLLLVLFIIFMPKGILGTVMSALDAVDRSGSGGRISRHQIR